MSEAYIQEVEWKQTSFGPALYIRIRRYDGKPMSWREVWDEFNESYPGQWAVQMFPPSDRLLDDANIYHLYVLSVAPDGVDANRCPHYSSY